MTRTKHIFRQDVPCLQYAALGDTAVRVIAIHHAIRAFNLDAIIVPQPRMEFVSLWRAALGDDRVALDPSTIPTAYRDARVSAPTSLDWAFGSAGWNVFESVLWENGFFRTSRLSIEPPCVFRCDPNARAAMIYPEERTDGNRTYNALWWIATCRQLRDKGYAINYLGNEGSPALKALYEHESFDRRFPPTLEGLRDCVSVSSVAIGGSTGPTWVCLMSDIPQVVLESKKSPHGYWFFDRCQKVLAKRLQIVATVESTLSKL